MKHNLVIVKLTLLCCLLTLSASSYSQTEINCDDKTTQMEMNECANEQFKAVDAKLNQYYQEIMRRLKIINQKYPDQNESEHRLSKALRKSQKLWISHKDAECKMISDGFEGGTVRPLVHAECLTKMTRERAEILKAYTNCSDYDFSCPFPNLSHPDLN